MSPFVRSLGWCVLSTVIAMHGQSAEPGAPLPGGIGVTVECIGTLENRRDPKCYATASRLEDFMYGTPLSDEGRFAKIDLQKELIRGIWGAASAAAQERAAASITADDLVPVLNQILPIHAEANGNWRLTAARQREITIEARDKRQYSTVAYALRAILAVQQEALFTPGIALLSLDAEATQRFTDFLDLYTLAALQLADHTARGANSAIIEADALNAAWAQVGVPVPAIEVVATPPVAGSAPTPLAPYALSRKIIVQKVASYEAYNEIALPVFLRNIQVYFARHRWPSDSEESTRLKGFFTETMIVLANDLLSGTAELAMARGEEFIRVDDVNRFVKAFIPHELNEFEDAVFFPRLPQEERITLEAYDMDAFRDSGLHWQYLGAAIDEPGFEVKIEPDPFALEMLVENIAQFGVLVLRVAGEVASEEGADLLSRPHLEEGLRRLRAKIAKHAEAPETQVAAPKIASASDGPELPQELPFFTDVTEALELTFEHRSADWLSRMIRSYAVRDESVAVLAIPPAFGGSGAAAEDINGDGLSDLLLLSGTGNGLFLNNGQGGFREVTASSGIIWLRPDGTPGEPRQPIIADFDNDGVQDILITYVNDAHRLYKGIGGAHFVDVTVQARLGGEGLVGGPATAFDYDKDGLLDLYITYFGQYIDGVLPTLARRNVNGLPNKLFRNTGGFRFEDVTEGSGVAGHGWTQAVSHTDFNLDGWQDLIEGNDFGSNAYYQNRGDGTFEDVTEKLGTSKPSYSMNVGIADLNGDACPDIYISNIVTMDKDQKYVNPSSETRMKFDAQTMAHMRVVEANDLFVSQVSPGGEVQYIQSPDVGRGKEATGWAWGADFFDFDNDGDDDLYVANGMNEFAVYSAENPYYKDPEGKERDVRFPESNREHNVFFLNDGGKLLNASDKSGADLLGNSRAVAYLDLEPDGDLDMLLNNYHGPSVFYRNNSEQFGRHWLKLKLTGDPSKGTTRDAIGASIIVTTATGDTVWRELHGSVGYLTMHPKEQHFGLGPSTEAAAEVRWPNGEVSTFSGLSAGFVYHIDQATGACTAGSVP